MQQNRFNRRCLFQTLIPFSTTIHQLDFVRMYARQAAAPASGARRPKQAAPRSSWSSGSEHGGAREAARELQAPMKAIFCCMSSPDCQGSTRFRSSSPRLLGFPPQICDSYSVPDCASLQPRSSFQSLRIAALCWPYGNHRCRAIGAESKSCFSAGKILCAFRVGRFKSAALQTRFRCEWPFDREREGK